MAEIPPPGAPPAPEAQRIRQIPKFINHCMKTPCEHSFHKNCLQESLKHNDRCPVCRASIPQIFDEDDY